MAASKKAGEILESVIEDGRDELEKASAGLAHTVTLLDYGQVAGSKTNKEEGF